LDFVDTGLNAVFSPLGMIALTGGVIAVWAGATWPIARWLMLGAAIYFSSLAKFNNLGTEAPALAFPFETLVRLGRPLTIAALAVIAALAFVTPAARRTRMPIALYFLFLATIYLDLKIYVVNPPFALLSFAIYALVFFVMARTVAVWLGWERDLRRPAIALLFVGAVFSGSVFYQMRYGVAPIAFVHGRLHGTTGNAQHAGVLLAAILPAAIYALLRVRRDPVRLTAVLALTAAIVYCLLWTGSRTAVIMAICGLAAFLVRRPRILAVLTIGAIFFLIFNVDHLLMENVAAERFTTVENNRIGIWTSLYKTFSRYPLLGAPLEGERIGFGESSWLSMAAAGGLAGLIPLVTFAVLLALMMFRIFRTPVTGPARHDRDFVLAGWATLMVGSVAEAYLLGIVSPAVLILYLYALMGQRHLDLARQAMPGVRRPPTPSPYVIAPTGDSGGRPVSAHRSAWPGDAA
jgi:hypothetical protein